MLVYIMKRTQIYLDDDQDARLERRARASGQTKSALIREAINRFLARDPAPDDLRAALEKTAGALPDLEVPDRGEWDRGYA